MSKTRNPEVVLLNAVKGGFLDKAFWHAQTGEITIWQEDEGGMCENDSVILDIDEFREIVKNLRSQGIEI